MIITPWKCNQSSYVSCPPVYNSYYREQTGKEQNWAFLTALVIDSQGFPTATTLLQESGELCSLFSRNPAKLAVVWCLKLCVGTLFVLLLNFGIVWLWVAFWWWFLGWSHRLQCIVIVRSFLRLLKLHTLAVGKLSGGGVLLCVTVC